jgi:hypothetical protein
LGCYRRLIPILGNDAYPTPAVSVSLTYWDYPLFDPKATRNMIKTRADS